MGRRDGEYILLHWDPAPAGFLAVRGDVGPDRFWEELEREEALGFYLRYPKRTTLKRSAYGPPRRLHAAWRMDGVDECGDPRRTLRLYDQPGRGRFLVTVVDLVNDWRDHIAEGPEPGDE